MPNLFDKWDIRSVLERSLDQNNSFEFCKRNLQELIVNSNSKEKSLMIKQNVFGANIFEVKNFNKLSDSEIEKYMLLVDDFRSNLFNENLFMDKIGNWIYSNRSGSAMRYIDIKNRLDAFLYNGKEIDFMENDFFKLVNFIMLNMLGKVEKEGYFSKKSLIENGLIDAKNNFAVISIVTAVGVMKKAKELGWMAKRNALMASLISDAIKIGEDVVVDSLIDLYGDLEKDGNYLLGHGLYFKFDGLVDFLLPKIQNFNVDYLDNNIIKLCGSAYEVAIKTEYPFIDGIKDAQDRMGLLKVVKSEEKKLTKSL